VKFFKKIDHMKYLQVLISAETSPQGLNILNHLMSKQLAFGGPVFSGPASFLGKVILRHWRECQTLA
jgi:hypothetical protein